METNTNLDLGEEEKNVSFSTTEGLVFTRKWFQSSEIKRLLEPKENEVYGKLNILEIGCFEGMSTCWFAENMLKHPDSVLYCVDPFTVDPLLTITDDIYQRFLKNIHICGNNQKIQFSRTTSDDFFSNKNLEEKNITRDFFDLIYVDGAHTEENIRRDMLNAISYVKVGGYVFMDDYMGGIPSAGLYPYKKVMDDVLEEQKMRVEVLHRGYQLSFRRTF